MATEEDDIYDAGLTNELAEILQKQQDAKNKEDKKKVKKHIEISEET